MASVKKKSTIPERAEAEIISRIHSGELPVGSKLPTEPKLAETLGISRGSLREALKSLQDKGYISRTPRGGSYIRRGTNDHIGESITAQVQTAELKELIEFREAIEVKVVQYVIDRATDEEINELASMVTGDRASENMDYHFHYRLVQLSQNHLFVVFLDMYYDTIARFAEGSYRSATRSRMMKLEHVRIVEAIRKRDKKAAVSAVKSHLHNVFKRVSEDYGADV